MDIEKTPRVKRILQNYEDASSYADSYHDLWDRCYKAYSNKRTNVSYEGVADTFIPVTHSTVETILANVASGKPKFTYIPTDPIQKQDTEILNSLVSYYWDLNDMSLKVIPWIRDSILYGTGILHVYWEGDSPCIKNIPLRDFFIDPAATRIEDARYAGYRYLTTIDELKKAKVLDPATGKMRPRYKNLHKLNPEEGINQSGGTLTDKEQKDQLNGSTFTGDSRKNQVECIYYATPDRITTVASRLVEIEDYETPYAYEGDEERPPIPGFLPFAAQRNYIDSSLFYAKGDVEVFIELQEMLNDVANQKIDNISYSINHMWALDPAFAHLKDQIESVPGAVITAPEGAITPIQKPQVTLDADTEILRIKNEIRDASGADEVVQGVRSDQRTTATEINAQISQAGQRFAMKLSTLESEGFKQLGDILFKMIQVFVDQPTAVRVVGTTGTKWEFFHPEDYIGGYEPRVMLEATAKAQEQMDAARYQNLYQVFMQDPTINQTELKAMVLEKTFGLKSDEVQTLLTPDEMTLAMAAAQADPEAMAAGETPGGPSIPSAGTTPDIGPSQPENMPL